MLLAVLFACLLSLECVNGEVLVGSLPTWAHQVQGDLYIIDQSTMVIREFYYDSTGPDAHLYWFPTDNDPPFTASNVRWNHRSGGGHFIPHPNSQNSDGRFPRGSFVRNGTLQFSLPDGVLACDMAVLTIWCRLASTHFTGINIPASLFTEDPNEAADGSKILCPMEDPTDPIDPTVTSEPTVSTEPITSTPPTDPPTFENCEQLHESLSVSWTVDRTSNSVTFMLCGCTSSDSDQDNTWLGFGLSGSDDQTLMFGADASIVWVDEEDGAQAEDYFLSAYTQCRNGIGACPDTVDSSGACSNDITLLQGYRQNGEQCVVYSRNFAAGDECDLELDPDREDQYIVWGVGGLGETAFRHFVNADRNSAPLHLGRDGEMNCGQLQCSSCPAYQNQILTAASDATFVAHIGPSGDQRGYIAITGRAGWGIAWFINGTLIPELVVTRGQTYTFIVYGGDDFTDPARYHPFYITSSPTGGLLLNQDPSQETVYAGFEGTDPIGVGPLCEYQSSPEAAEELKKCDSVLSEYESKLTPPDLQCGGETLTNIFTWTPDGSTPDTVYYQCASHLNLGYKISVKDPDINIIDTGGLEDASTYTHASFTLSVIIALTLMYLLY